ncbi:UPF0301 protein CHU_1773 [Impatiens glandulifera]|uniref:UPF0301 protein CHU_1773 n=1 Tax=Impatiens glandulifera TaxID=253017 RepID=UPI001FB19CDC|nr:UPF0301 protein CHU_1773 [Impatiens glandulifera]
MEACFLCSSSSSSNNLLPFAHSLTRKFISHSLPIRNLKNRTHLVTCCQMGASRGDEEHLGPIINSDWRSFRAKLVIEERRSIQNQSQLGSPSTSDLTIADKWVHAIHEPERGCLLIATEKLDGVHIFERTVILLLSMGPVGPTGIILNRPSLMSIKETKSTALDVQGTFSDRQLFFGGPLEESVFLVREKAGGGGGDGDGVGRSGVFDEVMKGIYYGTKESVGCASEMVKRNVVGVDDFRFFDGYCGWEREQLRDEIGSGYWNVAACSPSVIGLSTIGTIGLWDEVLGLMGQKKVS